jgi:DNA-binding beta-propeller fold protein YncE
MAGDLRIWVTNFAAATVSKINPANGLKIADYPTGSAPLGVAYDGTSIWVANLLGSTVSKINPD